MSRVAVLEIPAPADWINSNDRLNRFAEAKLVRAWRQAGKEAMEAMSWPPMARCHVAAHFWKERGGRYDPNNLWPTVKAAVDGVVDAGFLVDDDHRHVVGPDMRHGGKGRPLMILTFTEIVP